MEYGGNIGSDQLLAFVRILREGSFSRAAQSLGLGQPAISSRIHALEAALGGALFRRGRRVSLTPLGESFAPYARRTLDILSEGWEGARLAREGKRGRVTLGALGSLCESLVAPALKSFLGENREVECVAKSGDHETILNFLGDGVVDLGLIVWPCANAGAVELHPLALLEEPVIPVVHAQHPLAKKRKVAEKDLAQAGQPLFLLRWWQAHHPDLVRLARQSGTHVEIPKEVARRLVLDGLGVGFFPKTYIAGELREKKLVELKVEGMPALGRKLALVARKKPTAISPVARKLSEELGKQAEKLGIRLRGKMPG